MQFGILFVGAMVFAFYQFVAPPLWFNPVEARQAPPRRAARRWRPSRRAHRAAAEARRIEALRLVAAGRSGDAASVASAKESLRAAHAKVDAVKARAAALVKESVPRSDGKDTNYVFLRFVLDVLPTGVVGLVLAAVFAASMSVDLGRAERPLDDLRRRRLPQATSAEGRPRRRSS